MGTYIQISIQIFQNISFKKMYAVKILIATDPFKVAPLGGHTKILNFSTTSRSCPWIYCAGG